jgi:hypothetical protein
MTCPFVLLAAAGENLFLTEATGAATVSLVNASKPAPVPPAQVAVWKYKTTGRIKARVARATSTMKPIRFRRPGIYVRRKLRIKGQYAL